jgi:hypothetical protein
VNIGRGAEPTTDADRNTQTMLLTFGGIAGILFVRPLVISLERWAIWICYFSAMNLQG